MPKFYATRDSDGNSIQQNADIRAFGSEAEARAYLLSGYILAEWDVENAVIEAGDYSDCWIKMLEKPKVGDRALSPFAYPNVIIRAPGGHPGGRAYWITPRPNVLVMTKIDEITSEG